MGSLDARGDISIAMLIIYPFIFVLALVLSLRHGFSRKAGWLFLVLFATAKITGAILLIVAELQSTPSKGLLTAAYAVEGAGLGPLLECTLSFLGIVGITIVESHAIITRSRLRFVHLLILAAIVLYIVGALNAASNNEDERDTASTLRKVGGVLFLATLAILALFHLLLWKVQHELMEYQKTLLKGISCSVPFLAIRVLYSALSAFSPASSFSSSGSTQSSSPLAKFNSVTGSWQLFLIMTVLPELIIVTIYIFFGLRLPINKGAVYERTETPNPYGSSLPLFPLFPRTGTSHHQGYSNTGPGQSA